LPVLGRFRFGSWWAAQAQPTLRLVLHDTHTIFARVERVNEDELFDDATGVETTLRGRISTVGKPSMGYIRDLHVAPHVKLGLGGLVSRYAFPAALDHAYGDPTS
jgi:hypothetical protein